MARMTVTRAKDVRTPKVIQHKVADIRGGVVVNSTELGGDYLREGAVISAPVDGIAHVVKIALVAADVEAAATTIQVKKYSNLAVGDYVMLDGGAAAVAITAIEEGKTYDTITVGTTLGAISAGGYLIQAAAAAETGAALKYTPAAIVGTGKPVIAGTNLDTDAWVIAVTTGNPLPDSVATYLKGIINY